MFALKEMCKNNSKGHFSVEIESYIDAYKIFLSLLLTSYKEPRYTPKMYVYMEMRFSF